MVQLCLIAEDIEARLFLLLFIFFSFTELLFTHRRGIFSGRRKKKKKDNKEYTQSCSFFTQEVEQVGMGDKRPALFEVHSVYDGIYLCVCMYCSDCKMGVISCVLYLSDRDACISYSKF